MHTRHAILVYTIHLTQEQLLHEWQRRRRQGIDAVQSCANQHLFRQLVLLISLHNKAQVQCQDLRIGSRHRQYPTGCCGTDNIQISFQIACLFALLALVNVLDGQFSTDNRWFAT